MKKNRVILLVNVLLLMILIAGPLSTVPVQAQSDTAAETVTIPGTLQSELGCTGDWMPSCSETDLTYDAVSDIWKGTFEVTPNNDQDKKGPATRLPSTAPGMSTTAGMHQRAGQIFRWWWINPSRSHSSSTPRPTG